MPAASTAVLEFQPVSADGDFGLRCLDNSVVTITGQPRTAGKLVTQCKLTANVTSGNTITGVNTQNGTVASTLEASASSFTDNATSGAHGVYHAGPALVLAGTTQTGTVWLAQGSGTNNRYVRVAIGNGSSMFFTIGFYSDIDLQAGTAGTVTAVGNGAATSVSITPEGRGYLIKITGKVNQGSNSQSFLLLAACTTPGTNSYAGNTTQCFIYDHASIVYASSISDTTFNVNTDTGWLAGDAVCVASTTRTATECELYPLNANAGASSFASALYPGYTHHGTAPVQAEIGLLTRNVKIRSTSTTLMSYVYCTALSTVTASWAEFYYLGVNTNNKRAIDIDAGAVANPKSFTYCSIHDCDSHGFFCAINTGVSLNVMLYNSVLWNSLSNQVVNIANPVTNSDWVIDSNLLMRGPTGFQFADIGGTLTNNTVVGCTSDGFALQEGQAALGTFSNNTAHSNSASGLYINAHGMRGTADNLSCWRCSVGVTCAGTVADIVFNNLVLFGNTGSSGSLRLFTTIDELNITGNSIIAGDSSFASTFGIYLQTTNMMIYNLSNVDMSGTTSIFVPHTGGDFSFNGGVVKYGFRINTNNCKFASLASLLPTKSVYWQRDNYVSFQKCNGVAGDHRTEMTCGQLRTDSAVYHTASPSMKMTPNNASNRLESAPLGKGIMCAVNSGDTVTASVWVRKDVAYTGSQPRLIVRANAAIGINVDTVLMTATDTGTLPTMWDAATTTAVTLSGGNLVATNTGTTSADQGARIASANGKTSGKYYFEITTTIMNPAPGGNVGFGVATTASTYTGMGNNATAGVAVFCSAGGTYVNGANPGQVHGAFISGNVAGVAVDLDNYKAWIRKSPSGNWNASGTANPATNVGGNTIPAGTIAPMIVFGGGSGTSGNVFTANFSASGFTGTVPSGFTSGWPTSQTGVGTATWVQLSGTTTAATDDGVMEFIVDCDGTSGFINVDDWEFTTDGVTTTNDLGNWFNGLPASGTEGGGGGAGGGAYFSAGFV